MIKALLDTNVILDALASREPFRANFDDALISVCAAKVEAQYIVSRDAGFQKTTGDMTVMGPESFLELF